jgi:hypothetical protein
MDFKDTAWEVMEWIHLAQDRDKWRTLAETVTKFQFREKQGIC